MGKKKAEPPPALSEGWDSVVLDQSVDNGEWQSFVLLCIAGSVPAHRVLLRAVDEAKGGSRARFHTITHHDLLLWIKETAKAKHKRGSAFEIACTEFSKQASTLADGGKPLNTDLAAKIIKCKVMQIRETYLEEQRLEKQRLEKQAATLGDDLNPQGSKKSKPRAKSGKQVVQIGDEPKHGPHGYFILQGFTDANLGGALARCGVGVGAIALITGNEGEEQATSDKKNNDVNSYVEVDVNAYEATVREHALANEDSLLSKLQWHRFSVTNSHSDSDPAIANAGQAFTKLARLAYDTVAQRINHTKYLKGLVKCNIPWYPSTPSVSIARNLAKGGGPSDRKSVALILDSILTTVCSLEVHHSLDPDPTQATDIDTETDINTDMNTDTNKDTTTNIDTNTDTNTNITTDTNTDTNTGANATTTLATEQLPIDVGVNTRTERVVVEPALPESLRWPSASAGCGVYFHIDPTIDVFGLDDETAKRLSEAKQRVISASRSASLCILDVLSVDEQQDRERKLHRLFTTNKPLLPTRVGYMRRQQQLKDMEARESQKDTIFGGVQQLITPLKQIAKPLCDRSIDEPMTKEQLLQAVHTAAEDFECTETSHDTLLDIKLLKFYNNSDDGVHDWSARVNTCVELTNYIESIAPLLTNIEGNDNDNNNDDDNNNDNDDNDNNNSTTTATGQTTNRDTSSAKTTLNTKSAGVDGDGVVAIGYDGVVAIGYDGDVAIGYDGDVAIGYDGNNDNDDRVAVVEDDGQQQFSSTQTKECANVVHGYDVGDKLIELLGTRTRLCPWVTGSVVIEKTQHKHSSVSTSTRTTRVIMKSGTRITLHMATSQQPESLCCALRGGLVLRQLYRQPTANTNTNTTNTHTHTNTNTNTNSVASRVSTSLVNTSGLRIEFVGNAQCWVRQSYTDGEEVRTYTPNGVIKCFSDGSVVVLHADGCVSTQAGGTDVWVTTSFNTTETTSVTCPESGSVVTTRVDTQPSPTTPPTPIPTSTTTPTATTPTAETTTATTTTTTTKLAPPSPLSQPSPTITIPVPAPLPPLSSSLLSASPSPITTTTTPTTTMTAITTPPTSTTTTPLPPTTTTTTMVTHVDGSTVVEFYDGTRIFYHSSRGESRFECLGFAPVSITVGKLSRGVWGNVCVGDGNVVKFTATSLTVVQSDNSHLRLYGNDHGIFCSPRTSSVGQVDSVRFSLKDLSTKSIDTTGTVCMSTNELGDVLKTSTAGNRSSPRLFVVNRDGSGAEVHRKERITAYEWEQVRGGTKIVKTNDTKLFVQTHIKESSLQSSYSCDSVLPKCLQRRGDPATFIHETKKKKSLRYDSVRQLVYNNASLSDYNNNINNIIDGDGDGADDGDDDDDGGAVGAVEGGGGDVKKAPLNYSAVNTDALVALPGYPTDTRNNEERERAHQLVLKMQSQRS